MREIGQRPDLLRLVNRPHLCGLRNRNNARLHVMLVADPVIGVPHRVERDLSILMRQRDQLASRMLLRRTALVGINVRVLAAQHRMVRPVDRLQAENIRASAVERKEDFDPRAKVLLEFRDRRTRVVVVAVRHHVTLVGACDRLKHLRMHSGIVIAGKATSGRTGNLWHKKTM